MSGINTTNEIAGFAAIPAAPKDSPAAGKPKPAKKNPTPKKVAPKAKATKPAKAKDKPAAKTKTKPAPKKPKGDGGFKWTPERVAFVKALIALGAVRGDAARTAEEIGKKAKNTQMWAKHHGYKDSALCVAGYIGITSIEDSTLLHYYLTAAGAKAYKAATAV